MRRALGSLGVLALFSAAVFGQAAQTPATPAATANFDVADVHVRAHSSNPAPFMTGGVLRGGRYDLRNATMLNLISAAYGVDPDTVLGGPNWLDRNRFDIIAKAPASTPPATLDLMLQSLLADRFKLVIHKDTKPVATYALTQGSGKPRLTEAKGQGAGGCNIQQDTPQPGTIPSTVMSCRSVTMDGFLQNLRGVAAGYVPGLVADLTGLKGSWDFDLKFTARRFVAPGGDAITLFAALDQQLGLKLALQKVPTPVLVVDAVNDKPTDNPSGVAQNLPPPPPAEFDVADIKLSPPDAKPNGGLQPGGRIDVQGVTMKELIALAWDTNDDELVAGAPKWFDVTKYTLVAKAPTSIAGTADNLQIDFDDLRLMLRALLVERFNLTTHTEDRPVSAYTLVVDKPKLQRADPANRTTCINGPAPGAKDPRDANPMLNRLVTCQNMTMAQFAEDLPRIAAGYIKEPVVDATGLDGAWDFTLNFTGVARLQAPGAAGAGALGASDPTGALSLFDALQKQLGVKLEMHKRPMPVLVIDHVEEKPINN
jgi:uncharacterized protein (TIGR03435 family)